MYKRYKERFGTAGLAMGILALILAFGGTALAASGALTGKEKKEVKKIAKKYAGTPGANGTNGTNGAKGASGEKGDKGDKGEKGDTGSNGTSVTTTAIAAFGACGEQEGVELHPSGEVICNGEEGLPGPPGSPWPAGGTLPAGATETGTFTAEGPGVTEGNFVRSSASFPIPLAASPTLVIIPENEVNPNPTNCPGSFAAPKAASGFVCFYTLEESGLALAGFSTRYGVLFSSTVTAEVSAPYAYGDFAVTG